MPNNTKTIKLKMSMAWLFCLSEEVSTPPSLASLYHLRAFLLPGRLASSSHGSWSWLAYSRGPNSPWNYTIPLWDGTNPPGTFQGWDWNSITLDWTNSPLWSPGHPDSSMSWRVLVNVLDHQTIGEEKESQHDVYPCISVKFTKTNDVSIINISPFYNT